MHVCHVKKKMSAINQTLDTVRIQETVCTCYYFTKELSVVHRINKQRLNVSNETPFRFIPRTTIKPFIYYYGRHAVNTLKVFK